MIRISIEKCTGCKMCEVACVFYHTGTTGRNKSRIKVVNLYEIGIDGPVVCQQCKERYCMICPDNAISKGKNGQINISHTVCSYCDKCVVACPIGAIELFEETYLVCDLCGGDPKCVKVCTEKAIEYFPDESEIISLKTYRENYKNKTVGQKQSDFIYGSGQIIRKKWRKDHA